MKSAVITEWLFIISQKPDGGKREDIIQWIKETGGDLANKAGRTQMHLAAQVKVQMYLGNYGAGPTDSGPELILYLKKEPRMEVLGGGPVSEGYLRAGAGDGNPRASNG